MTLKAIWQESLEANPGRSSNGMFFPVLGNTFQSTQQSLAPHMVR